MKMIPETLLGKYQRYYVENTRDIKLKNQRHFMGKYKRHYMENTRDITWKIQETFRGKYKRHFVGKYQFTSPYKSRRLTLSLI